MQLHELQLQATQPTTLCWRTYHTVLETCMCCRIHTQSKASWIKETAQEVVCYANSTLSSKPRTHACCGMLGDTGLQKAIGRHNAGLL